MIYSLYSVIECVLLSVEGCIRHRLKMVPLFFFRHRSNLIQPINRRGVKRIRIMIANAHYIRFDTFSHIKNKSGLI